MSLKDVVYNVQKLLDLKLSLYTFRQSFNILVVAKIFI